MPGAAAAAAASASARRGRPAPAPCAAAAEQEQLPLLPARPSSCLAPCAGGGCTVTLRSVHYLTGKYQLIRPGGGSGGSRRRRERTEPSRGSDPDRGSGCEVPGGGRSRLLPSARVGRGAPRFPHRHRAPGVGGGLGRVGEAEGQLSLAPQPPEAAPAGLSRLSPGAAEALPACECAQACGTALAPGRPPSCSVQQVPGSLEATWGPGGLSLLACCRLLQPAEVKVTKGRRPATQQRLPLPVHSPARWQTLVLGGENLGRCSQTGLFCTPMLETSYHPK